MGFTLEEKNKNAKEFVLIDVNELAKGSEFYQLANWSISPNEDLMAYAEDTTGRREYTIKFKDLVTGETYKKVLSDSSGDMAWSSDGKYLFYVLRDKETLLPFKLFRHKIGSSQEDDVLVYEEKDPTFIFQLEILDQCNLLKSIFHLLQAQKLDLLILNFLKNLLLFF